MLQVHGLDVISYLDTHPNIYRSWPPSKSARRFWLWPSASLTPIPARLILGAALATYALPCTSYPPLAGLRGSTPHVAPVG